jgi:hypothetical protein
MVLGLSSFEAFEQLRELDVKISQSLKDLDFELFFRTAGLRDFFTIWKSHQTLASRSFPNSHRNGIL